MKVAIVGAGLAGLACALELEKLGVQPVVFEQRHRLGSPFPFAAMLLDFIFHPVKDQLQELRNQYHINLKPIGEIRLLRLQGPRTSYNVRGHLGYILLRGQNQESIENQLASGLKTPVRFVSPVAPKDLLKDFDYIVVADGSKKYAQELGIWQSTYRAWVRGANITGKFNPREVRFWFNTGYAKSGFACMVPLGIDRAVLTLSVPQIDHQELDKYWQDFIKQEKIHADQVLKWETRSESGLVFPHRIGNTFLAGNSGGFVSGWLGFGVFSCLISGVETARAIALGQNYEKRVSFLQQIMERQARCRMFWNTLNNHNLDNIITLLGNPITSPLWHGNPNVTKLADHLIAFWLKNSCHLN
ncbi:NAD(P)/FAD-dependent oxidoreductase [Desulforamulus hydrothermalis]|uniref:FAD dependent oxidoreductase n=1 Tax=Desulforamulus hydrothermalis Lam5 = DSM 18033 TaxID=1121428 RepID=K8EKK2_9FIRM|nr:NAD(P)-binding protein [Desulforamulus hydrothermalis]CCO09081.1 FAD dependent oxidoreductase [Desulforamulus hydrothermalis Lam5 = DSM 18033]SHG78577.1 Dehydrogenase (flavoprotein) [Desulforamulus hydrothermalis Lam5 = DSM 18033]